MLKFCGLLRVRITVLTSGIGRAIGLIEAIIHLTTSDQDFVQTYLIDALAP